MAETLVIRLPLQADEAACWIVIDALGHRVAGMQRGPLSLAAAMAGSRRVVVLVPGSEVLLTEPELPVRGGARLQQVVPFALEDAIAEDVETMHFAVGKRGSRPGTPVAAVAADEMRRWTSQFAAEGLRVDAVHADTSCLPANPGQIVVALEAPFVRVRRPDALPVTLPGSPLADSLTLAGALDPDPAIASTQHLLVYVAQSEWPDWQAETEALADRCATMRVQLLPEGLLTLFAQQLVAENLDDAPINLLQGNYAGQSSTGGFAAWRTAAILAGVLLLTHVAAQGLELWRLKNDEKRNATQIEQVFRQAMPDVQNAANARQQMEGRLGRSQSGATHSGLLESLSALGSALTQVQNTALSSISYRDTILDLKLTAPDVASLDQVTRIVTQRGFAATLEGTNQQGAQFEGHVNIKSGGRT